MESPRHSRQPGQGPGTEAPAEGAHPPLSEHGLSLERGPVVSSFISSAGYDPDRKWLALAFKNGRLYVYAGVPAALWQAFQRAPSKGRFYNKQVRHHYAVAEAGRAEEGPGLRSTELRALDYLHEERMLLVEFGSGHVYRYRDVPEEVYWALKRSESAGAYFNRFVRDLYEVAPDEEGELEGWPA